VQPGRRVLMHCGGAPRGEVLDRAAAPPGTIADGDELFVGH
jgi:hypothetical protein